MCTRWRSKRQTSRWWFVSLRPIGTRRYFDTYVLFCFFGFFTTFFIWKKAVSKWAPFVNLARYEIYIKIDWQMRLMKSAGRILFYLCGNLGGRNQSTILIGGVLMPTYLTSVKCLDNYNNYVSIRIKTNIILTSKQ